MRVNEKISNKLFFFVFEVIVVEQNLQFRAKLIFRTFISDDRAVGIEDKSLSLMSKTFNPWHKNN